MQFLTPGVPLRLDYPSDDGEEDPYTDESRRFVFRSGPAQSRADYDYR